jgi:hypothetical protein
LVDSNFPAYAVDDKTKGARISLFKSLYTNFCRLQFSHVTDKPFAISGLEQRLTDRFEDVSGAGIFGKHKGRCLLWRRAEGVASLKPIEFGIGKPRTQKPPSWSFIAHEGGIEYIDVPGHTVDWDIPGLRLTGTPGNSWLYAEQPSTFDADAFDFETDPESKVVYDMPGDPRGADKCVKIGKSGEAFFYILVVRPAPGAQTRDGRAPYKRAGAGYIPTSWLKNEAKAVKVDII